jgi:RhoGEF domain
VRELLENEENYVRALRTGINNYMTVFNSKGIPKTLRGQKHRIFANIKSIYKLHKEEFLPQLTACFDDPEQIAEVFIKFLSRDYFYGYIVYAINRKRSELLCNYHVSFWKVKELSESKAPETYVTKFHFHRKFKTRSVIDLE